MTGEQQAKLISCHPCQFDPAASPDLTCGVWIEMVSTPLSDFPRLRDMSVFYSIESLLFGQADQKHKADRLS
jgi:hypothetical protein